MFHASAFSNATRLTRSVRALLLLLAPLTFIAGCSSGSSTSSGCTSCNTPPPAALSISTTTLANGTSGTAYTATLTATGGSGSGYAWSVSAGALPTGVTLSAAGNLSGTPSQSGTFNFTAKVIDSGANSASAPLSLVIAAATTTTTPLTNYEFTGDTSPVHDPAIIRQGSKYYVFVTDAGNQTGFLPIRCSSDKIAWSACGYVFSALPSWVSTTVPAAVNLWAPDLSFFNGVYHLYYTASSFGSQTSAIGLATSPTLDQTDPAYKWTDQGPILTSTTGSNFNAIDPNIMTDTDGTVWLTYGSYWNGIFQQQIDPLSGKITPGTTYHLAQRSASDSPSDAIEGASVVHKGSYYYLFTSWDACCNSNASTDNYKIVIGRGTSVHGPFLDMNGTDMAAGGGYILLQGDNVNWSAPGGQTAYIDSTDGDLIVFHALSIKQNYLDYLFVRSLDFSTGWPVIGTSTASTPTGIATTTALTATPNPVTSGSAASLSATVTPASGPTPTGTVSFYAGSSILGTCTLNGSGSCALSNSTLAVGTYSITAVYMGSNTSAGSTSTAVSLTVQAPVTAIGTTVTLTTAASSSLQGLPLALNATVTPNSGTALASGTVTFSEGQTVLATSPLDSTGKATFNTAKLAVGSHSITAAYGGSSTFSTSTSTALALTINAPTGKTFTNPISITDANGKVISCPDPAIIKSQSNNVDTWYMYCTGDAHNLSDTANGGLNFSHKINVFSSSDLVNWTSVGDALNAVPSWAGSGALYWAPAVKFLNNKYFLYYVVTVAQSSGTYAIGVATSTTPSGPFIDSGTPAVASERVTNTAMDGSGTYRSVIDPDVIADSTGQLYILFGSYNGGISVRKLSADGLTSDPSTETQIAADQRYEGGAWIQHGGYFYLLASATNCCAGPLTGYGVFAGRATTPMGPYLDQQGKAMTDVNVGGSPVLAMNGNTAVGPGGGSPFTDEAGQSWYVYHEVLTASPYYSNTTITQRPAAIDAIDWINGWPVVRGGYGPSDAASPQPVPASQPATTTAYTTTANTNDAPGTALPGLSQDFTNSALAPQWTSIHSLPKLTFTGSAVSMPTVGYDTVDTAHMPLIPILAEATPAGDYMVEVKLSTDVPDNASIVDYAQAGLILYKDDVNYLRIDLAANSDTRQVEYIKSETPEGTNYPVWSATDLGPATSVNGTLTTYLRLVKRTIDGKETYTGYNSTDGTTWVRCGAWTHTLGSGASIGLYGGNRAGYNAAFSYVHVTTLQ